MGMFDGILGGVVGAEMAIVVNGLIQKDKLTPTGAVPKA